MKNLSIAFPEKSNEEKIRIAKDFYHNLIDTFIETIKLLSVNKRQFEKRFTCNDFHVLNDLFPTGQNVQIHGGHFFNWEFANHGIALNSAYPFVGVYMPIANKVIDRIMYQFRSRYGTILIPATDFKTKFHQYAGDHYVLGLAADQSAGNTLNAYWTEFFGRKAPFVKGPEKGARLNNTAIIYANYYRIKRGYHKLELKLLTTRPNNFPEGDLTKMMIREIEDSVRKNPANYLWSHRRWKHEFDEEKYGHLVV